MTAASRSQTTFYGRSIVPGSARGPALVCGEPLSFLGDVDIRSGTIVGDLPSVHGMSCKGRVLLIPFTRGSAGAWRFLYQLKMHGTNPIAIILSGVPDPSVVQGAILSDVPVISNMDPALWDYVGGPDVALNVDGAQGRVQLTPTIPPGS